MYIDKEILTKILKDHTIFDEKVMEALETVDKIKKEVDRIESLKRSEKIDYDTKIAEYNIKLKDVRDKCPHYHTETIRCAASGRTEYDICQICGKDLL